MKKTMTWTGLPSPSPEILHCGESRSVWLPCSRCVRVEYVFFFYDSIFRMLYIKSFINCILFRCTFYRCEEYEWPWLLWHVLQSIQVNFANSWSVSLSLIVSAVCSSRLESLSFPGPKLSLDRMSRKCQYKIPREFYTIPLYLKLQWPRSSSRVGESLARHEARYSCHVQRFQTWPESKFQRQQNLSWIYSVLDVWWPCLFSSCWAQPSQDYLL